MNPRPDYGMMRREQLALRLAMTYHQVSEDEIESLIDSYADWEGYLIDRWLPVAEMAIHECLE